MFSRFTIVTLVFLGLALPAKALQSADPMVAEISEPWFGDFSDMKKQGVIRVLIPYSLTSYYLDKGKEKGITVEYMREFERFINRGVKRELDKVRIVLIPTPRNELVPGISEGRGDIAAADLTITPERHETIDFSNPVLTGVREVVLTRKEAS